MYSVIIDIYENLLKNDSVLEVENFFSARYQQTHREILVKGTGNFFAMERN